MLSRSQVFVEEYDPTIEDTYRKQCVIDDQVCLLNIVDTAIRSDYIDAPIDQWICFAEALIVMYSITSRESFDEITKIFQRIVRTTGNEHPRAIVVANKCDLEVAREVSSDEGRELASVLGVPFIETSAKTCVNVSNVIDELVRWIRRDQSVTRRPVGSKMMHR